MTELLTPKQVSDEYGYSRSSLIEWEKSGVLKGVQRTPGNQRRYTREQIEAITKQSPQDTFEKPSPTNRRTYDEFGTPGLQRFGGAVVEERLRELQGRSGRILYREMALNDPVIAAVLFALRQTLKQADKRVTPASDKPKDKEAAEFVESALNDMSFAWLDTLTFIVDPMLEQGFSLLELIYKRRLGDAPPKYTNNPAQSKFNDGRIGWRKWSPRPAESLAEGDEWIFDDHGGLQGINQIDPSTGKHYSIPIMKLLHFRTTVHPANTPEPPPIHRPAYLPYWYTSNLAEIEGIGVERNLNGTPVIYLGNDRSFEGGNSDYEKAKDIVTGLRVDEQAGIVIPGPKMGSGAAEGEGFLLELLSVERGGGAGVDIGSIIERYDKRKALVTLAQFIMLGMEQVGSFALSRHQGDLFILAASAWIQNIADIINRHAIPRLMRLNSFPGITGIPELVFSPLGIPDLKTIAEYINKLVDKQVITPDAELENHLRMIADLPEIKDEERAALRQTASNGLLPGRNGLAPQMAAEEMIQQSLVKHAGELINLACPFCGNGQVETFKDHGDVAVCPGCEMSFSPDYHYGGYR